MFRRMPRASGYFRTSYAQDLALVETRLQRVEPRRTRALRSSAFRSSPPPFQLDLACQVCLAAIGALSLMLLTGYAGQISLGHAGLLAAGAFTTGILFKELNAPFWVTLPAAALIGAPARRGVRPALAPAARPLSRGLDARAAFRRRLSRRRIRDQARLLDRHRDRSAAALRLRAHRSARLVLRAARLRGADADALPQPPAQPHRPRLAGDPRERDRGRGARHQHRRLQAPRLRHQLGDHGGRRCAVRLLPRLRLGRGVLAVPVDPVRRDDHHRRHGLAARRAARRRVRHAVSLRDRSRPARAARRAALCRRCCSP